MSIQILLDAPKHPARDAAIHSITCVQNKDREGWLSMWEQDGIIEDPVGPSPLDPEGKGHRGIEKIAAFYDNVIAPGDIRFHIRQTFACGSECANVGTITTRLQPASSSERTVRDTSGTPATTVSGLSVEPLERPCSREPRPAASTTAVRSGLFGVNSRLS